MFDTLETATGTLRELVPSDLNLTNRPAASKLQLWRMRAEISAAAFPRRGTGNESLALAIKDIADLTQHFTTPRCTDLSSKTRLGKTHCAMLTASRLDHLFYEKQS